MASVFATHGQDVLAYLKKHEGQVVDTQQLFSAFTLESFAEIAFGEHMDAHGPHKQFATAFNEATHATDARFLTPFYNWLPFLPTERALRSSLRVLNPIVRDLIARRKTDTKPAEKEDLLSYYLTLCGEDGKPFTDEQLRDFVLNFMFGSFVPLPFAPC